MIGLVFFCGGWVTLEKKVYFTALNSFALKLKWSVVADGQIDLELSVLVLLTLYLYFLLLNTSTKENASKKMFILNVCRIDRYWIIERKRSSGFCVFSQ